MGSTTEGRIRRYVDFGKRKQETRNTWEISFHIKPVVLLSRRWLHCLFLNGAVSSYNKESGINDASRADFVKIRSDTQ